MEGHPVPRSGERAPIKRGASAVEKPHVEPTPADTPFDSRPCPACAHAGPLSLVEETLHRACEACGALVSDAAPAEYGADYYFHDPAHDRRAVRRARLQLAHLARFVGSFEGSGTRPLRVLELGCSKGFFVSAARAAGFDAYGLDVSSGAIAAASERGLGAYCTQAHALTPRAELPQALREPFDVVVAWEVLEHLDRPEEYLAAAHALLAPGGAFVASTPNAGSVWRRGLGAGWHGFAIPQYHRVYFTGRAFEALATRCGWSSVRTSTTTERAGDLMLLRNGATELVRRTFGTAAARGRVVRVGAAACLAPAAFAIDALAGHVPGIEGDTLLVCARRG